MASRYTYSKTLTKTDTKKIVCRETPHDAATSVIEKKVVPSMSVGKVARS